MKSTYVSHSQVNKGILKNNYNKKNKNEFEINNFLPEITDYNFTKNDKYKQRQSLHYDNRY